MSNPYRHPISTPVPELQGIATIAPSRAPVCDKHGLPMSAFRKLSNGQIVNYCHHCLDEAA